MSIPTWRNIAFLALLLVVVNLLAGQARAADPRETRALELYAAGDFGAAREIFAKLFAETKHPTYLRNIGRCYQNLREPARAIAAFKEYLRLAKNLSRAKRVEVEGFIAEMEDLERKLAAEQRAKALAEAEAPPANEPKPGTAPPVAPRLSPPPPPQPSAVDLKATAEPAPSRSLLRKGWFWTLVGVVAAGGAAALVMASRGGGASPVCPDCSFPTTPVPTR